MILLSIISIMQRTDPLLLLLRRQHHQQQRQHLLHLLQHNKKKRTIAVSSMILILSLLLLNRPNDISISILGYDVTVRAFNIQHTSSISSLDRRQQHLYHYDHYHRHRQQQQQHRQTHPFHCYYNENHRQQQKRFVQQQLTGTSSTLHMSLSTDDAHNQESDKNHEDSTDTIVPPSISLESLYQQRLQHQIQILRQKDRSSHPIAIQDLKIVYEDDDIIVVDKPAGILCLPSEDGVPSIVETVFQYIQQQQQQQPITNTTSSSATVNNGYVQTMDQMVVHRLGYDTAGLVVLAKTIPTVRALHALFRTRPSMMNHIYDDLVIVPSSSSSSSSSRMTLTIDEKSNNIRSTIDNDQIDQSHNDTKQTNDSGVDNDYGPTAAAAAAAATTTTMSTTLHVNNIHDYMNQMGIIRQYEVLVAGHVSNTTLSNTTAITSMNTTTSATATTATTAINITNTSTKILGSGIITLPLMRCYEYPPYMRVSTLDQQQFISTLDRTKIGTKKLFDTPKYSVTYYEILSYEYYNNNISLPVTRLTLTSITGRTHQLNVHCAAIGHPIVRDAVYGYNGTAVPYGGLVYDELPNDKACFELQDAIYNEATNQKNTTSMCVHATFIRFQHPITGIDLEFTSTPSF